MKDPVTLLKSASYSTFALPGFYPLILAGFLAADYKSGFLLGRDLLNAKEGLAGPGYCGRFSLVRFPCRWHGKAS